MQGRGAGMRCVGGESYIHQPRTVPLAGATMKTEKQADPGGRSTTLAGGSKRSG